MCAEPGESEAHLQSGVETRFHELMVRYRQPLYRFLLHLLADPETALDCTQDTFLRAYQNLSRGRPVVSRWLYTVAYNRAMDELRRRRKERTEPADMTALPHPSIEEQLLSGPVEEVRRALARLSPSDRELLHLHIVDRLTSAEIGAALGISPTAVRMRVFRSRERFRRVYGEVA